MKRLAMLGSGLAICSACLLSESTPATAQESPYIETQSISVPVGASAFSLTFFPNVPAGQRLEIEHVTGQLFVNEENLTALCRLSVDDLNQSVSGQRRDVKVIEQPTGLGFDVYRVSEPTQLFLSYVAGTPLRVTFRCNISPLDTARSQTATISGHFIPVP